MNAETMLRLVAFDVSRTVGAPAFGCALPYHLRVALEMLAVPPLSPAEAEVARREFASWGPKDPPRPGEIRFFTVDRPAA